MIVVKLGGSLYSSELLQVWVDAIASLNHHEIIIVPGGGPFADQVRSASNDWKIDDETAHDMAVLAMQQYGYLIASLNRDVLPLSSIDSLSFGSNKKAFIWFPYQDVIEKCDYPKSWHVTSDSIALWLANYISAEKLCMIKSADIGQLTIDKIGASDIVDNYFAQVRGNYKGEIEFYNVMESVKFIDALNHE